MNTTADPAPPTAIDWTTQRLLILDRDDQFRFLARTVFQRKKPREVLSTASLAEAVLHMTSTPVNLCLVGFTETETSGLEFLRWLRDGRSSPNAKTPVVALTESTNGRFLAGICKLGVEGLLRKPLSEDGLMRRITNIMSQPRRIVIGEGYVGPERREGDPAAPAPAPARRKDDKTEVADSASAFNKTPSEGKPPDSVFPSSTKPSPPAAPPVPSVSPRPGAASPAAAPKPGGAASAPRGVVLKSPSPFKAAAPKPANGGTKLDFEGEAPLPPAKPAATGKLDFEPPSAPATRTPPAATATAAPKPVAAAPAPARPPTPPVAPPAPQAAKPTAPPAPPPATPPSAPPMAAAPAAPPKPMQAAPAKPVPAPVPMAAPAAAAPPASAEPKFNLAQALDDHGKWVRSRGLEGKRAVFEGLDLSGEELSGAILTQADMRRVILAGAKCLETAFDGADLRYSELTGAILNEANLAVTRLRHAQLPGAVLDGANLRGADLSGANLRGASLKGARLHGAIVLDAQIAGADFTGAEGLVPAQVAKMKGDATTILPAGLRLNLPDDPAQAKSPPSAPEGP
ncbi:MAG: pentapeptide repeat-containing protein [Rhodospirillales bacterium]|nr:pentapeptide repeat-containing protein [Rhodospirillales bacterium]